MYSHLIKFGLKRDLKRAHLFSHLMLLTREPSQAHSGKLICLAILCCLLESLLEPTQDICLYEGKVNEVNINVLKSNIFILSILNDISKNLAFT